jgi:hypothetical protein
LAGIRAFEAADIQQVANLHQKIFGVTRSPDIGNRYTAYFTDKFLDPVRQGALPSLVFEDENGEIAGFIGIATRWFVIGRRRIRAAVSSQFIAEPRARSRLIAVALLRDFLNGPQDFSFTDEANETSRILWEKLGGSTSVLYSLHWIAPLRPTHLLLSKSRSRFGPLATLAGPIANLLDGIASVFTRAGKPSPQPDLQIEPLHAHALTNFMSGSMGDMMLHPDYDAASLRRMLDDAARQSAQGTLQAVLLRSRGRQVAGWYLYCLDRRGTAEVLQVGYRRGHREEVIDHLFNRARLDGASALAGRMEPHMGTALANQLCLLDGRQYSMLVHSRDPEVLNAIHSGNAFISRLDGEWCLRFC